MTATAIGTALEQRKAGRKKAAMEQYRTILASGGSVGIDLVESTLTELGLTPDDLTSDIDAVPRLAVLESQRNSLAVAIPRLAKAHTDAVAAALNAEKVFEDAKSKMASAGMMSNSAERNLRAMDTKIHELKTAHPRLINLP